MSTEALIQRLDERTERLMDVIDKHVEDDKKKFEHIFKQLGEIEVKLARGSMILTGIMIISQIIIGSWIKGLF